jgi:hypothetical protein
VSDAVPLLCSSPRAHTQARKAAAIVDAQPPNDRDADARLEREAQEEERDIKKILDDLDLHMHEVRVSPVRSSHATLF